MPHITSLHNAIEVVPATTGLQPFPYRVFVASVHHIKDTQRRKKLAADVDTGVVSAHQQYTSSFLVSGFQMFESLYFEMFRQVSFWV